MDEPSGSPKDPANTPTRAPDRPLDLLQVTDAPPPVRVDPYLGRTMDGRYLIESLLGEGGMGVVYAAKHKVIGKRVAIKVLRGEMARDAEMTERFLQEAKAASSIGNPHIVDISDFGTLPDGSTYFVMEYLGGQSLAALMEDRQPVKVPRLLHIAKQIAAGLGAAHDVGIVHRDLKPDNVMLITRGAGDAGKDFVKILDFGIAKVGAEGSRITRAGSVFGTPHYMSPEQAAGTSVDRRTDIYALGIILYEMASGKVPFDADNFMGILTQHMYKTPVPILALVPAPQITPALDAVIQKCLTKKVEGRYATMGELLEDLEKIERGEVPGALGEMMARSGGFNVPADYFRVSAMPAPVPATPPGSGRRRVSLFVAMGIVATLGIAALAVTLAQPRASKAEGLVASAVSTPSTPPPPASASVAAPAASSAAWVAPVQHVGVVVTPVEAKVLRDGVGPNLNDSQGKRAVAVDVVGGVPVALEVSAPGYKTSHVSVDGALTTLVVRLEAAPAAPKPKPAKSAFGAQTSPKKCDPLFDPHCDPFEK